MMLTTQKLFIVIFCCVLVAGCQSDRGIHSILQINNDGRRVNGTIHNIKTRFDYRWRRNVRGYSICAPCGDFALLRLSWEVGDTGERYERVFDFNGLIRENNIYSKLKFDTDYTNVTHRIDLHLTEENISIFFNVGSGYDIVESYQIYAEQL